MKKRTDSINGSLLFVSPDPSLQAQIDIVGKTQFPSLSFTTLPQLPQSFHGYDVLVLPYSTNRDYTPISSGHSLILYGPLESMPIGFLQGCADYLVDPWYPEELFFRAIRLLPPKWILIHGVRIQVTSTELQTSTLSVPITYHEFRLLEALKKSPGSIVPRSFLESLVPHRSRSLHSRIIDIHISRLRKKILTCLQSETTVSPSFNPIHSFRGYGYLLWIDQ